MDAKKIEPVYLGPESDKSGRFITLSVLIHAAMMASLAFLSIPAFEAPHREVVEFEVASDTVGPKPILDGSPVEATQGPSPELPKAPIAKATAPVAVAAPVAKDSPVEVPKADLPPAPVQTAAKPVSAPKAAAVAAAPATIEDIQTPDLVTSDSGDVVVPKIEDQDLSEDFEKVDQAHNKKLQAVQKDLDDEANKVADENAAALAKAEKENQERLKAQQAADQARRDRDAKAIAAAQAAEKAAAEKAARAAAEREAREAAQAARGQGGEGEGSGNSGSPEPTKEVAGIPGGVRALDQLKQMPGNKLPQYDRQERLQGQQGTSIFYAYVNKNGTLSQFKMGQSTGFRNLDAKTLAALKQWKFYPGQEGWVEMPYEWVLSGEAMEAGGQLRK